MSLYMGDFFLLITVLFTSSLNFSSEKKNVKDSSGAFIGQENGYLKMPRPHPKQRKCVYKIIELIIKVTISSLVIDFKKSYFPLIPLPSCYRTVCYWTVCYRTVQKANHIQRCSLKQPITFKVVIMCACACTCFGVYAGNLRMFTPPLSVRTLRLRTALVNDGYGK